MTDIDITTATPKQVDDFRYDLCDEYQKLSDRMIVVEQQYAEKWLEVKGQPATSPTEIVPIKTNTETDRIMDTTDVGKERIELKYKLKSTEKKIGALKDRMHRLNLEARNVY